MDAAHGTRPYTKREVGRVVKRPPTAEPKLDPTRSLSLAGMSRRDCPTCGPDSLFCRSECVNCGYDSTPVKQRTKGLPRNIKITRRGAVLRHPIVDTDSNLLALMAVKA